MYKDFFHNENHYRPDLLRYFKQRMFISICFAFAFGSSSLVLITSPPSPQSAIGLKLAQNGEF